MQQVFTYVDATSPGTAVACFRYGISLSGRRCTTGRALIGWLIMVAALNQREDPFGLVVTGEANFWQPALERIVGRKWLITYQVTGQRQLLEVVESGLVDAAVLDDEADLELDALQLLRMIHRFDELFPVVVVTSRTDRSWLENALRLAAFSVVVRPLELEELLRQIQRMMRRLDEVMRRDGAG